MIDPNFLFSLPPFVEQVGSILQIVLGPSGGDDSARMRFASERLQAVGGGTLRLTEGEYFGPRDG